MSSPVEGERLGAVNAIERILRASGASFHDLADRLETLPQRAQPQPPPPPRDPDENDFDDVDPELDQQLAKRILETYKGPLSPKDRDFLKTIVTWRGDLSEKRLAWLQDILNRVRARGWRP